MKSQSEIVLRPIRPNLGIEAAYRAKIDRLIEEMHRSLIYWLKAAYRRNEPEIAKLAQDAPPDASGGIPIRRRQSPARALSEIVERLARQWQDKFDELAPTLAKWFAEEATKRSDASLKAAMRKAGFTVQFKMTRAANDAYQATIVENVGLIKSIAQHHLTQVQGSVMRSVQAGRDLGMLAKDLQDHYGVTKRRAALISRDQNNKATAVITRVRQQELGITEAQWLHSGGGKQPRPSHVKASREKVRYTVSEGWYDPDVGKNIWPGELISCRCVAKAIIPGFSSI